MRTEIKLSLFAIAMFGFGYALVPLYNVFCDITGLNGKTGTMTQAQSESLVADRERTVTVEFDTNVNSGLPWSFHARENRLKVHPGELTDVVFIVENKSDKAVMGQAVPSVAPAQASLYFNKTECFCFSRQTLAPGERREMTVRFVVDTKLPEKISTMTLSYTYFPAPGSDEIVQSSVQEKPQASDSSRI